jgi:hypothetical protein
MSEGSGSAFMEGSNRRRWLVSAAIVLLLHVCIAAAVLTWRHATWSPPVLVDLTPPPSAPERNGAQPAPPSAEQTSPQQPAPEQKTESASASAPASLSGNDRAASGPPAESTEAAQSKQDNAATARDEAAAKPVGSAEASRGVNMPQLPASPQNAEAKNAAPAEGSPGGTAISGGGISRAPESGEFGGPAVAKGPVGTNSGIPGRVASNPAPTGLVPTGPAYNSPMANMPLDTSITVQPPVHGNSGVGPFSHGEIGPLASRQSGPDAAPFDERPTSVFRSAKPFGVPDVPRNSLLPNGNAVVPSNNPSLPQIGSRTAPGAHVQDRARAAMARAMGGSGPVKNAIGSTVTGNAATNGASGSDNDLPNGAVYGVGRSTTAMASRGDINGQNNGIARSSIGVTANFRPLIPRANAGENKTGAVAVVGHEMPTAPVINGHNYVRPLTGPGMIGGPARNGAGMLNGSDFHLRRP